MQTPDSLDLQESLANKRAKYRRTQPRDDGLKPKRPKTMRIKTALALLLLGIAITALMFGFLYQRGKRLMEDDELVALTTPPQILYSIYEGKGRFSRPIALTVRDGKIYVSNNNLHNIEIVSETGKAINSFGGAGSAQGQLLYPYGIGILPNGNILAAETGNLRIQEFSPKGQFIQTFIGQSNKIGLEKPGPLFVDSMGRVYIGDLGGHQVIILNKNKKVIRKITGIQYPHGLTVDEQNHRLYVADSGKTAVKVFDLTNEEDTYELIETWKPGTRFTMIRGLATDKHGRLYVTDTLSCAVRVFDKNGEYIFSFGQQGFKDGEFLYPNGIFVDSTGKIHVADWGNDRIQVWGY